MPDFLLLLRRTLKGRGGLGKGEKGGEMGVKEGKKNSMSSFCSVVDNVLGGGGSCFAHED